MSRSRNTSRDRSKLGKHLRRSNTLGKLNNYGEDGTSYGLYRRRKRQQEADQSQNHD